MRVWGEGEAVARTAVPRGKQTASPPREAVRVPASAVRPWGVLSVHLRAHDLAQVRPGRSPGAWQLFLRESKSEGAAVPLAVWRTARDSVSHPVGPGQDSTSLTSGRSLSRGSRPPRAPGGRAACSGPCWS